MILLKYAIAEKRCEHGAAAHVVTVDNHVRAIESTARVEERNARNAVIAVKAPVEILLGIVRRVHDGIINGSPGDRQPRNAVTVEIAQGFEIMHVVLIGIATELHELLLVSLRRRVLINRGVLGSRICRFICGRRDGCLSAQFLKLLLIALPLRVIVPDDVSRNAECGQA